MVEVFVWRKRKDISIGHASMRVTFDDGTRCSQYYISWWPSGDGSEIFGSPNKPRTYREDCDDEAIPPHRTFVFNGFFDEAKIASLWEKWKSDSNYQLLSRNCSTLVRSMMCHSGMGNVVQFTNFCSYNIITTPDEIEFYCDQLEKMLAAKK